MKIIRLSTKCTKSDKIIVFCYAILNKKHSFYEVFLFNSEEQTMPVSRNEYEALAKRLKLEPGKTRFGCGLFSCLSNKETRKAREACYSVERDVSEQLTTALNSKADWHGCIKFQCRAVLRNAIASMKWAKNMHVTTQADTGKLVTRISDRLLMDARTSRYFTFSDPDYCQISLDSALSAVPSAPSASKVD